MMKGFERLVLYKANIEVGRRKWDGQWFIKINDAFIKIDEWTHKRIIKQYALQKDGE